MLSGGLGGGGGLGAPGGGERVADKVRQPDKLTIAISCDPGLSPKRPLAEREPENRTSEYGEAVHTASVYACDSRGYITRTNYTICRYSEISYTRLRSDVSYTI